MMSESARARFTVEQVTCHRTRKNRCRADPERLDNPPADELRQGAGERAYRTSHDERGKAGQHQPPSAESVRQRPDEKLTHGEGDEEAAERGAQVDHRRAEGNGHVGKRRQDDVGGERSKRRQAGKQEQQFAGQRFLRSLGLIARRHVSLLLHHSVIC
jgi:hypothetical protein